MHRLTALSLRHPALTLALAALFCALAGVGALRLRSETGYRAALGADHAAVRGLDAFIADFGGGLPIQVAWSCDGAFDCVHPLDQSRLEAAERIAAAVRDLPGVKAVHTPGNTPLLLAREGGIEARRLLGTDSATDDIASLADRAKDDPFWQGVLISEDGRAAAMVVEIESSDPDLYAGAVNALLAAVEKEDADGYALVGDPIDFVAGGASLNSEAKRLGALATVLVALTIWILFRRALAVLPALATVGIAAAGCLGLMGWLGWPENEVSQAIVPLLLVIGICDAVHYLSRYRDLPREAPEATSPSRRERLVLTARDVGWPCLLTSVTTAAGLASFTTSDLAGFVHFGVAAAAGVVFALVATFSVLPVLVDLLRLELPQLEASHGWVRALDSLTAGTQRHSLAIVLGCAALLCGATWGIFQLRVDVTKESLLGSRSPLVQWQRWVADHLRRPDSLEVRLTLPEQVLFAEPEVLNEIDSLSTWLEAQPHLGRSRSVLDAIERMHQLVWDDDPEMLRLGTTREQNEQLLFALSSYDRDLVDRWLTLGRHDVRISVEADLLSKEERAAALTQIRTHLDAELPDGWSYELTGPLPVFNAMVSALHATQIRSFTTAALVISLVVALCLRSLWAALWVMVPTLFPVALTLGAMGIVGTPLDTGTAMIAAIVLGIAVDDSVHLVTRYKRKRRQGQLRTSAMRDSVAEVGRAVVATSLALAAGFLVMLLSSWGAIAAFGLLSACAILAALAADLFLLPAILFLVGRRDVGEDAEPSPATSPGTERGLRLVLILVSTGGGLLLYTAIGAEVLGGQAAQRPLCAPLENGVVPISAALTRGCPLRPFELVRRSDADMHEGMGSSSTMYLVRRDAAEASIRVPLVPDSQRQRTQAFALVAAASALFLGIFLAAAWTSPAAAATPLVLAGTAFVTLAGAATLGPWSAWATRAGAVGLALLPGALLHLALTFPAQGPVLRGTPRLPVLIYGALAVTSAAAVTTYVRFPELYAFVAQLLVGLCVGTVAAVLIGAIAALRRQGSALQRLRARILLLGVCVAAVAGLVLLIAPHQWIDALPGGRAGALALTMLTGLLPLAYAVHRYHLFDARLHAAAALRLASQATCFVALVVMLESVVSPLLPERIGLILAAFGAWCGTEVLNVALWGRLRRRSQRQLQQMSDLGSLHTRRTSVLSASSDLARQLRETVEAARNPGFVTVFLRRPTGWYPADASGGGPTEESIAVAASQIVRNEEVVYLGEEESNAGGDADALRSVGIDTIVPLGGRDRRLGLVLLGAAPDPLSSRDREFLESMARQTVVALSWAEAAEQIGSAGALARRGFLAASLTHDLGKPLSTIWSIARSALRPGQSRDVVDGRLHDIQEVADQGLSIIDRLFHQAQAPEPTEAVPVGEVVTLVCHEAERIYGHPVSVRFGDELPDVTAGFEIHQALMALLANACRESPTDRPVEVSVSAAPDSTLRIEVVDHGTGMDDETCAHAFDPWFTRRRDQGGRGLGLALCRLLVRQRGGDVEILETRPGKGTRMRIVLPTTLPRRSAE